MEEGTWATPVRGGLGEANSSVSIFAQIRDTMSKESRLKV